MPRRWHQLRRRARTSCRTASGRAGSSQTRCQAASPDWASLRRHVAVYHVVDDILFRRMHHIAFHSIQMDLRNSVLQFSPTTRARMYGLERCRYIPSLSDRYEMEMTHGASEAAFPLRHSACSAIAYTCALHPCLQPCKQMMMLSTIHTFLHYYAH
ncbi:hypothetical protein OE88DRAFT_59215 [Heliocybe sulcata]|uniref:Uncharacterized protein n=1 Tax=Heliocybe sulcata TaxID=5364 RepID=A0A5C3NSU9_9AGAM|nr:hypothetical protein OE88DRAFT_59215 [Heliocybe sulcata]